MAYTKTQWISNQKPAITATNLNKMEQGIEEAHILIEDVGVPQSYEYTRISDSWLGSFNYSTFPVGSNGFASLDYVTCSPYNYNTTNGTMFWGYTPNSSVVTKILKSTYLPYNSFQQFKIIMDYCGVFDYSIATLISNGWLITDGLNNYTLTVPSSENLLGEMQMTYGTFNMALCVSEPNDVIKIMSTVPVTMVSQGVFTFSVDLTAYTHMIAYPVILPNVGGELSFPPNPSILEINLFNTNNRRKVYYP